MYLKRIDVKHNNLHEIGGGFAGLACLEELDVSFNFIKNLDGL